MTEALGNAAWYLTAGALAVAIGRRTVRSHSISAPGYRSLFGLSDDDNMTLQRASGWLLIGFGTCSLVGGMVWLALALLRVA